MDEIANKISWEPEVRKMPDPRVPDIVGKSSGELLADVSAKLDLLLAAQGIEYEGSE